MNQHRQHFTAIREALWPRTFQDSTATACLPVVRGGGAWPKCFICEVWGGKLWLNNEDHVMRRKRMPEAMEYIWHIELGSAEFQSTVLHDLPRDVAGDWRYASEGSGPHHVYHVLYSRGEPPNFVSIMAADDNSPVVCVQVATPRSQLALAKQVVAYVTERGGVIVHESDNLE